ncbi:MAG: hypothetical protein HY247_00595 [archaeon]|nr:MAG: hypothetical protein HY247_00595 [archaeon]
MKATWGVGAALSILIPVALSLFQVLDPVHSFSLILLLLGLWTLVAGLVIMNAEDRNYYVGWGIVLAVISLFAYLPLSYTFGLIVVAVIVVILINVYTGQTGKVASATPGPPQPAGGSPAPN